MGLVEIKRYLMQAKQATLGHLCRLFELEPDTIRFMLQPFIQKGKVRKCTKKPACGSQCVKCPVADIEMYEWVYP